MAISFGNVFGEQASLPLAKAADLLNQNRLGDGLRALEPEKLSAGVREGLSRVSALVGLPVSVLETTLDLGKMPAQAEALDATLQKALKAVRRQEMTVAMFAVPHDLTVAKSPVSHLRELATTFSKDKEISSSLKQLAIDVEGWEGSITRARLSLDQDGTLASRYERRKALKKLGVAAAVAAVAVIVLGVIAAAVLKARRDAELAAQREAEKKANEAAQAAIVQTLALPPCDASTLTDEQRARATEEQKGALELRAARCAEEKKVEERKAACHKLVESIGAGKADGLDEGLVGDSGPVLKRIAQGALEPGDLATPKLPCDDLAEGKRLWGELARASGKTTTLWALADGVSAPVGKAIEVLQPPLHNSIVLAIGFRAEKVATTALLSGRADLAEKAKPFCALKQKLGGALAMSCKKMLTSP